MKLPTSYNRRDFLKTLVLVPASAFLAACARVLGQATGVATNIPIGTTAVTLPAGTLAPTPACGDDNDEPTPAQTEGPFFTPDSPERTSLLEEGLGGVLLIVSGQVLGTDCLPIAGALLDFWHTDANGVYDNVGYTLRGHQFADEQGRYELTTILPGLYPGRTRHIHVKAQRPNGAVLTTQLFFPDEPDNLRDGVFDERLLLTMQAADRGVHGQFNFVLEA